MRLLLSQNCLKYCILGSLRKLEDVYGAALVLQVAQQFFGLQGGAA